MEWTWKGQVERYSEYVDLKTNLQVRRRGGWVAPLDGLSRRDGGRYGA